MEGTLSMEFPVVSYANLVKPKYVPMDSAISSLKWHRAYNLQALEPLKRNAAASSSMSQLLDKLLHPADQIKDLSLSANECWQNDGRKTLEQVEREMCEKLIMETERKRGILREEEDEVVVKKQKGAKNKNKFEVDLHYSTRVDMEQDEGKGYPSLVLIPSYQLHYKWRGYDYHLCVVDGELDGGEIQLQASRPYDYAKMSLAGLSAMGVAAASCLMINV